MGEGSGGELVCFNAETNSAIEIIFVSSGIQTWNSEMESIMQYWMCSTFTVLATEAK